MDAKSESIKAVERKSGGCAPKAVELTSGDLPAVAEATGAAVRRSELAAEVSRGRSTRPVKARKARTVPLG
jgi:hypothetical protein